MRWHKVIIYLFTIPLLMLIDFSFLWEKETTSANEVPLSFSIQCKDHFEKLTYWEQTDGSYYVFFPGYVDFDHVSFDIGKDAYVEIDGIPITEGMPFYGYSLCNPYSLYMEQGDRSASGRITFVQSGKLPVVHIDTYSGNMDYIHAEKGNSESGTIRIYTEDGQINYRGALDAIRGRGNATWKDPKKPYSLKLSKSADLLGMGNARKWILLANAFDESHLRNKIAFEMAEAAGLPFTPDCRFVDVYLNGAYNGLYLLAERNEIHDQRVDISHSNSFLVSLELGFRLREQGYPHIVTENKNYLRVHNSSMKKEDLQQIWQSVENALLAENGMDPVTGKYWNELIDQDSWAMRMLLDEVLVNYDGGSVSQYFYYDGDDPDGKVKAGPIWDMDNCLAMGGWKAAAPNAVMTFREHHLYDSDSPLFFHLYRKPEFRERVRELYETVFLPIAEHFEETDIQMAADYISQSADTNAIRWELPDAGGETMKIQSFLKQRIAFLNDYWVQKQNYHLVHLASGTSWACLAVADGECIPDILETTEDWRRLGTGELFDVSQPIYEDLTIVQGDIDFESIKAFLIGDDQTDEGNHSLSRWEWLVVQCFEVIAVVLLIKLLCMLLQRKKENRAIVSEECE